MKLQVRALSGPAVLALLAGLGAALAHPPFGVLPGILGYGLLFAVIDRAEGPRPLRSAFWRAFVGGFAYFALGCWWVAEAFFVDAAEQGWMAPIAVVLLAVLLGFFWGVAGLVYRLLRPRDSLLKVLVFAGCLSALEWVRGHVLTGFPWNLPGETWKAGSAPSQAAALVGAYGLSWLTVAAIAALAAPFALGRRRSTWAVFAGGLALVAGLYAYGFARLAQPMPADPEAPTVRVVQADVRQEAKYDANRFSDILSRYVRLTRQPPSMGRAPDIVIWPEGAIPAAANDVLNPALWIQPVIKGALMPGQTLLMGSYRLDERAAKPIFYNSLYAVRREATGELRTTGIYDKYRLVPFGEYMPAETLMTAIGFKKMVHVGDGFTSGPQPRPLVAEGIPRVQPLICYESLFPGFAREGARLGGGRAQWIVNVSNDAWFGQTSGPWQHLNLASYRAIEEGLPVVRATPTGVSAVIDAKGRALRTLPMGAFGVIDAPLPPALPQTPFGRFGESAFWMMIAVSIAALIPATRARV